jgi:hypothetical protein
MIIIMQNTLEYMIQLSKTPNNDPANISNNIAELWHYIKPDNVRETADGIRYIKLEL